MGAWLRRGAWDYLQTVMWNRKSGVMMKSGENTVALVFNDHSVFDIRFPFPKFFFREREISGANRTKI